MKPNWLMGYKDCAEWLWRYRKLMGWAIAKGSVKTIIRLMVTGAYPLRDEYRRGWADALMDSLN